MTEPYSLIKTTLTLKLSTQGSAGLCLNNNKNYKSSFQYSIPPLNFRDESIEYAYYSVNHAVIPVSFYNMNESNNRLDLTYSEIIQGQTGTSVSYLFVPGNYNATTFKTHFLATLGDNWTISLDSTTNKFTIANSLYSFSVNSTSTISSILGFSDSLSSYTTTLGNTIEFPRVCNFLPTPRIHLRCPQFANSLLVNRNTNQTDILVSVPNDSKLNGQIVYHNFSKSQTLIDVPFLQTFQINITDDENNLVNFNGISSYFEISIDFYKRRLTERPPTFQQLIRNFAYHFN